MKIRLLCLIAVAALSASTALAGQADPNAAALQSRTAVCSQEAKALKGEERDLFIAKCVKKADAEAARHAHALEGQQNKMKKCNVEAGKKELKGDERRAFMSACLKA